MPDHDPYGDPTRADVPATDPTVAMPQTTGAEPPVGPPPGDLPPDEPPDRRPWILAGLLALVVLVGLGLLLLAGDDDDEDEASSTTSTTLAETTSTTEATTTTAAPTTSEATTTSTTAAPATIPPEECVSSEPDDPETTAMVVYEAFTLGDRACAANLATSEALDQLFAIPGNGGGWTFQGCFDEEVPDPHTLCGFSYNGGSTSFRMNYSETEGWTVYEVFQVAD